MFKPFFSIIIPTLNEAKYLPLLLEDLSNQTYQNFEVIIVDGKSDDQTIAKAKSFRSKLPALKIATSSKRHVCIQRNLGTKQATADIFIFSDADNRFPPYFLQGIKYRWELLGVDLLSPFITPDEDTPQNKSITNAINIFLDLQMNIKPHFLLEACFVVSKKCFLQVGGFNEEVNYGEGTIFMDKIIWNNFQAKIIKDPTYTYSLRRIKKYGTAKTINNVFKLQLMDLFGLDQEKIKLAKLYPMLGGNIYTSKYNIKKNKISKFIKNITKILKDF